MAFGASSPTPSMFKKKSDSSLMTSASSYLSAVSQADARARVNSRTPTATPALSLSSSITSSSQDTVLDESDLDYSDLLIRPRHPPNSEQVFTTVHSEFGHCANSQYRYTSQHASGAPIKAHDEPDPPYYILLSTYISYLILICIGHLRDFIGKRIYRSSYKHLMPHEVKLSENVIFLTLTKIILGLCAS
jgi:serine palmitoyltransferase